MKHSNLCTPRSLAECQFSPSMDPIERPARRSFDPADQVVLRGCLIAVVLLLLIVGVTR